jgi:hypothetical protein
MAEAQVAEVYADYNEIDQLLRLRLLDQHGNVDHVRHAEESAKAWDDYDDAEYAITRLKAMLNDLR